MELKNLEMEKLVKCANLTNQTKEDVKSPEIKLRRSASLPVLFSNKTTKFPRKLNPNSNESIGTSDLEKPKKMEENCIWNPLFGMDYLKKFPK